MALDPWKKEYQKEYKRKNREKLRLLANKWRKENPERARELQKKSRTKLKGDRKLREREKLYGKIPRPEPTNCEACGSPFANSKKGSCLDHDHATGEFRGWLCLHCNSALGYAKDSRDRLQLLINYLDRAELLS